MKLGTLMLYPRSSKLDVAFMVKHKVKLRAVPGSNLINARAWDKSVIF